MGLGIHVLIIIVLYIILYSSGVRTQEPTVTIRQGIIMGVQVYPESYPGPIHAYMGIPYAAPPIGDRRFAPAERHPGWNRTLFAANVSPNCLHSRESGPTDPQNEDCLFLNIWTPVVSERFGKVPVVIFFDGKDFATLNALHPIPGQDLAAEGLVVVTANYRLNVFGFLSLGNGESRGNMGLLDQYMVFLWVNENIEKFGGDRRSVTLMGYSSGAASVIHHLVSPRTKELFTRAIIMSGSVTSPWNIPSSASSIVNSSKVLATRLGCLGESIHQTLTCLRAKPAKDILTAFDEQYELAQGSWMLGPVIDTFLQLTEQYLPIDAKQGLEEGQFWNIPILTGLNNLEIVEDAWVDLAQQGYAELAEYVSKKAVPSLLKKHALNKENGKVIAELIQWYYFDSVRKGQTMSLLEQLQRLYSDAKYHAPIMNQVQLMLSNSQPMYVYHFMYSQNLELDKNNLNYSVAIHGSDLPFLFGPTLFQQLTRRRGRQLEVRLMKQMKSLWANFIKFGNPTPGRSYDTWRPFKRDDMFIQKLGENPPNTAASNRDIDNKEYFHKIDFWNKFLPKIVHNASVMDSGLNNEPSSRYLDSSNVYRHATYTLTGLVIALLVLLFVCIALLKQRSRERQRNVDF